MLNRKFVFLANPISGTKKKDALIDYLKEKTTALKIPFEFFDTNKNGDYNWLVEKIESGNITDVIIIGGDGTINSVLSVLNHCKINIGIIPSGSGNGLAFSANIPHNFIKAFDIIIKGKTQLTDAFMLNNKFACMLSGIGFDAQVAYDFAQQKKRGLITYTKQSLLNFVKATPYSFEVKIDEHTFTTEAFFISVANSNQFGNNFKIAPKASLSDGLLDIVIVQKMNKLLLPFAILKQLRGKNKYHELEVEKQKSSILYLQSTNISIKNIDMAPVHIDGDVAPKNKHLHYKIIKDCFNLIVP
jgi:diacylglycerol kinase (ATP)